MVNKIYRSIKIFISLARVNYLKAMEYRVDFFSSILPTGMYSVSYIVFISVILSRTPAIAGWTFDQMLVLFAVEQLFYYSGWVLYRRSINIFPELIRNGTMDMVLRYPVSPRLVVSFRDQSPEVLIPFSGAVLILLYALRNTPVKPGYFFLFIVFLVLGIFILYNLLFTVASFSFWTTEADEFVQLVDDTLSFGRYPLGIFPGFFAFFLLTVIPAIVMVYVPATVLLGILDYKIMLLSLVIAVTGSVVSQKVWNRGLRHYSSASS